MSAGTIVPQYVDLRYPDGKLAAKYDPARGILEVQRNGTKFYFDLTLCKILTIEKAPEVCYDFNR